MPVRTYQVPLHARLSRFVLKPAFRLIFRALARVELAGLEHIPRGRPYIAAMNHVSIYDPPFLLTFWPEMIEAVGAADVFKKKDQGPLLRLYGVIPVHRGEYDRYLIETMLGMLASGHPLVIAPEGGRSHETGMREALPGVGYILERSGVPVLPVGIEGTTGDFWRRARRGLRPRLAMHVGAPIEFPPRTETAAARRLRRQQDADLIMRHIAGLLPEVYHGQYKGQAIAPK